MTSYGPDDPSNRPTRMANYGPGGPHPPAGIDKQPPGFDEHPEYADASEPEPAPTPWYRKRALLAIWAILVAVLVVLIIYGLIELSGGGGGGAPSSTTSSTTTTPSSTTTPSTTTTTPSTSTSPAAPPPPPPTQAPAPTGGNAPAPAPAQPPPPPPPHHHLPHIPPTITLPHTVITLPPGI